MGVCETRAVEKLETINHLLVYIGLLLVHFTDHEEVIAVTFGDGGTFSDGDIQNGAVIILPADIDLRGSHPKCASFFRREKKSVRYLLAHSPVHDLHLRRGACALNVKGVGVKKLGATALGGPFD